MTHQYLLDSIRGAASVVRSLPDTYTNHVHRAAGIDKGDWEILRSKSNWKPEQARGARIALDKLLTAALTLANLPDIPLTAEYIAAVIGRVVEPANWMVAAYSARSGLDSRQLVTAHGDVASARETVSAERLFALILLYSEQYRDPSRQTTEEENEYAIEAQTI